MLRRCPATRTRPSQIVFITQAIAYLAAYGYAAATVPVRVRLEPIRAACPEQAAAAGVAPYFAALSPARELLVAAVSWAQSPALTVAPWTRVGVERAAHDHGLRTTSIGLEAGAQSSHGRGRRRSLLERSELIQDADLSVELPGVRHPRRIPSAWVGRHLCLLAPCIHTQGDTKKAARTRSKDPQWHGPVAQALCALDQACTPNPAGELAAGLGLAASVFASVTIVVDGSFWAPLQDHAARCIVPLGLCLCVGADTPSLGWLRETLARWDPWVAHKLGFTVAARGRDLDHSPNDPVDFCWPRIPGDLKRPAPQRNASTIKALWKSAPAPPTRAKLGPALPGELGRIWRTWSDTGAPTHTKHTP